MAVRGFGYKMDPVEVPERCPRCGSEMLDYELDFIGRDPDLAAWHRFCRKQGRDAVLVLLLAIVTLGFWFAIFGIWSLVMTPRRRAMKRLALEAAPASVRSLCRECGLAFYPGERAAVTA